MTKSNLIKHAQDELWRAGFFDPDSDYDGMIGVAVMGLIDTVANQGHSGTSINYVVAIFNQLVQFKALTPLTDDPNEWINHTDISDGNPLWQNRRQSDAFSNDGGKTYYSVDDTERIVRATNETK